MCDGAKLGENVWRFLCSHLSQLDIEEVSYVSIRRSTSGRVSFAVKSDGLSVEGAVWKSGSAETDSDNTSGSPEVGVLNVSGSE